MNAITRVINQGAFVGSKSVFISFPLPGIRVLILLVALLITAFGIVYVKDINRRLFIDYQNLQQINSDLSTNYEKLLLEKSAWARPSRIQLLAEQRLDMGIPSTTNVVMVKLK